MTAAEDYRTALAQERHEAEQERDQDAIAAERVVIDGTSYAVPPCQEVSLAGRKRYDQCGATCTTDCGHCKGQGKPVNTTPTVTTKGTTMRVIELRAENVKRLRAIEITPDRHVQVIGGRNAQGKTSVLDALWLALGGGTASKGTVRPIRDGETKASVRLDLGDLVITRTWTGDKTALTVASAEGAKFSSPQKVLDELIGRLSFDPLEFTRLSAREQLAALLDLVDLDVDLGRLARDRKSAFDDRTEIGRQGRALDGQLAGFGQHEDAPDVEVSAADLIARIRLAEDEHRAYLNVKDALKGAADDVDYLSRKLVDARAHFDDVDTQAANTEDGEPTEPLIEQLDGVEATNAAIRRNARRAEVTGQIAKARALHAEATTLIDDIDQVKADALAKAKFPVDGLGFTDDGVTYQGVPFAQASSAEQIRVSLAMAMALNPKLRVIRIMDGSLLDPENLDLIASMAKAQDFQVWIEKVGDDGVGVVIEDGEIAA